MSVNVAVSGILSADLIYDKASTSARGSQGTYLFQVKTKGDKRKDSCSDNQV